VSTVLVASLLSTIINAISALWRSFCYHYHYRKETFYGARSTCRGEGGDLVIISDREENQFVKDLLLVVRFVVFS
jgi:hypothetical protein